jgi:hypothetical protein
MRAYCALTDLEVKDEARPGALKRLAVVLRHSEGAARLRLPPVLLAVAA